MAEWLAIPPRLADVDLRGILYVSREHAPIIKAEDRLSSEAVDLLTALLKQPAMAAGLKPRLLKLPRNETTLLMDKLLDKARQEQEWGVPDILEACLTLSEADPVQGPRLAAFLAERPPSQIQPSIVPKISDQPWATGVFTKWESVAVSRPVKAAITRGRG
jgi:predicted KAP-like P-loop ATPase